jgi:hypothetical protein
MRPLKGRAVNIASGCDFTDATLTRRGDGKQKEAVHIERIL